MDNLAHLGPALRRGQQFTSRSVLPGFTVTYEVVRVNAPHDIAVKCIACVPDPTGEPYRVEVFDERTKQWIKVAECATREAGAAYLAATGRKGLVTENRK